MNPLLFPPTLIKRALDDLGAIADAARSLPRMEAEVRALREEMAPIGELPAVREAVEPLVSVITEVRQHLDALRDEMSPIGELHTVREGIEPLDEDMRDVRNSVDELEPLVKQISARIAGLGERIETLREDLAPLGELADKVPGVGR